MHRRHFKMDTISDICIILVIIYIALAFFTYAKFKKSLRYFEYVILSGILSIITPILLIQSVKSGTIDFPNFIIGLNLYTMNLAMILIGIDHNIRKKKERTYLISTIPFGFTLFIMAKNTIFSSSQLVLVLLVLNIANFCYILYHAIRSNLQLQNHEHKSYELKSIWSLALQNALFFIPLNIMWINEVIGLSAIAKSLISGILIIGISIFLIIKYILFYQKENKNKKEEKSQ